jgi:hypothetical protein
MREIRTSGLTRGSNGIGASRPLLSTLLGPWEPRKWLSIPATPTPSAVTARLPADASVYFLNLIDDRGYHVSTEHAFVTSAPVKRSDPIRPVSGAIKTPNVP